MINFIDILYLQLILKTFLISVCNNWRLRSGAGGARQTTRQRSTDTTAQSVTTYIAMFTLQN